MATNDAPNKTQMYALLIGVDNYSQIPLPDGSYYPHLGGCVRDINLVEQMLRNRLLIPEANIFKLTSTNTPAGKPLEPEAELPTYQNLVKAFKDITALAEAGDQLYIHYSGHGGRSTTMFPQLKGEAGLDESLVPADIGKNGACYLRDIELAYLVKAMSDKGLLVTMVLDSCHSGGATRGNAGAVPRGIPSIDTTKPPAESMVAPLDELNDFAQGLPQGATRGVTAMSGWGLLTPPGFVLMAACRANELANEYAFNGVERNGALTYWLLDTLKQSGAGFTYKMLYNRVVAQVHAKFVNQTPQLEGDVNREFFGGALVAGPPSVNVLKVEPGQRRAQLSTGLAQGVGAGAQFGIYPANTTDFTKISDRIAVVELETPDASETWARVVDGNPANVSVGCQAVLLGVGIRLRGRVRLTSQTTGLSEAEQAAALQRIEDEIKRQEAGVADGEKWVRLGDDKEPSDFQVAVNAHGEYEIWDANGRDIPNLRPALRVDAPGSPQALVKRLTHLTKYRNVRQIENTDPTSPLVGKITVELGILENHSDDSTFRPMPSTRPLAAGEPDGENGERFALRVTNLSGRPLNLAILDLEPDWCIEQVYPDPSSGKDSELLESGKPLIIKGYEKGLRATLPAGYQEGTDVLKVFVTDESTSFQWLTLPALDEPPPSGKRSIKNAGDPLEQLLSAFGAPNIPKTRKVVNMAAPKGKNWATAQVEIRARRPSIAHFPDPALSLFQSAVDEVVAKRNAAENTRSTRSVGNQTAQVARPELDDEVINSVAQFCLASARGELSTAELTALDKDTLEEARQRGAADTAKYCGGLAVGLAKEWFASRITGNTILYQQYEEALNKKFGGCDPKFAAALKQFAECLPWIGEIPYRQAANPNDAVIDGKLPAQATIGVVADWGTGEPEAIEVLRQVAGHNPHAAIHLGDIYYSGTEYEVENYFYQPWKNTLNLPASNILSLVVPGNHDLYAGGKAFYGLLDKLGQSHSFFCLRNADWQIIGLDTGLNDKLGGGPTKLADSEAKWLKDNIQAAKAVGRRTILMSHHQLFSANDKFAGKSYNEKLYNQLYDILPDVSLWLWGHEHDLVVFDKFCNLEKGRCIGGSAFPVGVFEMPTAPVNAAVPFNTQVALSKGFAFYQHCYTILRLDGKNATVSYYEDRDGGRLIFQETL